MVMSEKSGHWETSVGYETLENPSASGGVRGASGGDVLLEPCDCGLVSCVFCIVAARLTDWEIGALQIFSKFVRSIAFSDN
jgi:hypothetical protein